VVAILFKLFSLYFLSPMGLSTVVQRDDIK